MSYVWLPTWVHAIYVEYDVHEAINLIVEANVYDRLLMSLNCRKLLGVQIRHGFREANVVKDFLVKEEVNLEDSFRVILNSPTKILKLLAFDGDGRKSYRRVQD